MGKLTGTWLWQILLIILAGVAFLVWRYLQPDPSGTGFASGNGRIEAVEVDIAAKSAGRIKEILANEGDFVTAHQVLARMDTQQLKALLREAAFS